MFERPVKTLKHSLFDVLENAQKYVADVSFSYPNHEPIYAHKAILMARVPKEFRDKYMQETKVIDISSVMPYTTLRQLLRFWYIAEFSAPLDDASLLSSRVSGLSLTEASSSLQSEVESKIRTEIQQLEIKLGTPLLPSASVKQDQEQWINDLRRMMDEKISTDVVVNIFNVNQNSTATNNVSFPAHRFILASQSQYFYAVFCTEFREASTSSVHMPSDVFSATTLQVILYYFYTDTLIIPPPASQSKLTKLNAKKHELRILQKTFTAADFLGHYETICKATLLKMAVVCHQFTCVCNDCAMLLPSMLVFADKHKKYLDKLRNSLISLYADPLDSLAPLWSVKPFAILVASMQYANTLPPVTKNKQEEQDDAKVISDIFNKTATPTPTIMTTVNSDSTDLIQEIKQRTVSNMNKHNSVRSLHSLHLCLSYLRGADPFPTWSQPTLQILNQFLHSTIDMISSNFDYYCVEYPILLSCVDGIGFGFSVDFLGFLLNRVLTEGIHDGNAVILYQGIVRDLGGRQEMVKNVAVDGVLVDSRAKCAQYIQKRWMPIKAEAGFNSIDKEILRLLSEDINVPIKTLMKPLDDNYSSIFSFKKSYSSKKEEPIDVTTNKTKLNKTTRDRRTRSLSASTESILIKTESTSYLSDSEDLVPRRTRSIGSYKRQGSTSSLTDALLPIEVITDIKPEVVATRQTRLRFALPDTPSRQKTSKQTNSNMTSAQKSSVKKNRKSRSKSPGSKRWSLGDNSSGDDDEVVKLPVVGQKVELLRRPLPTQGHIRYIGNVEFAKGVWVGVELESRLGNNDGSVDGKRYFQTFPQRGVFVKIDDFKIITPPSK